MNKFHLTTATKGQILSNIQEDRREEHKQLEADTIIAQKEQLL